MLDNRHMLMVEAQQVRDYHPEFLMGHDGVERYAYAPSTSEGSHEDERGVGQILH
jgi:hypothetical protein